MDCPICNVPLKEVLYEGVKIDHCGKCDGFWLDHGEMKKINMIHEERFTPEQIAEAHDLLRKKAIAARSHDARRIDCLHCGKECRAISHSGITVDECPEGMGMWLDKGEIEKLQIMAEERSHIFTEDLRGKLPEEEATHEPRGALPLFGQLGVFLHALFKR